ncbi:MAG: hypothetical protein LRZ88_06425 [Candidatus Cloacimonetes bacterium]|nr:hypothetical protein [Candidatus Cloacimonadota bacterium]
MENKSFYKAMKSELINFYESYMQHQDISHEPFTEGNKVLYTLSVWENHQEDVLDWQGNLTNEQIEKINKAIKLTPEMSYSKIEFKNDRAYWVTKTYAERRLILSANDFYDTLSKELGSPKAASQFLLRAGIDGIKYPVNALSGGTGDKGYNYVVFDDSQITILETTRFRAEQAENTEAERQMAEVRKQYEGTEQWMKAPNGKPTNLNERQWLQVRTQLFKDWFGDWENDPKNASKVVDSNGEPMVVYHGTPWLAFQSLTENCSDRIRRPDRPKRRFFSHRTNALQRDTQNHLSTIY